MKKFIKGAIGLFLLSLFCIPFMHVKAEGTGTLKIKFYDGISGSVKVEADTTTTCSDTTNLTIPKGTSVTLTATPSSGHRFLGWSSEGNIIGNDSTYTFTFDNDYVSILVSFGETKGNTYIYATDGGKVAVDYSKGDASLKTFESSKLVNRDIDDEITVKAQADEGYEFIGWYEYGPVDSIIYKGEIISTAAEYTYIPEKTIPEGRKEPINNLAARFEKKAKEYTVKNDIAEVSFRTEDGHTYELNFFDVLSLSLEELNKATGKTITEEEYKEIIDTIKAETKEYGNLIGFYAIEVNDGTSAYTGAVNVKVKLTEEMKKYNTFKFIYVDDSNGIKIGEIADFKIEGDYLVGTLPHLSAYALVGSNVTNPENPNTIDGLKPYILVLGLSLVGILSGVMFVNNKKSY